MMDDIYKNITPEDILRMEQENKKMEQKRSKCCNAPVEVGGEFDEGTAYYVCLECDKPCDLAVGQKMDRTELREKEKELARQLYWWSRANPKRGKTINLERLTERVAKDIEALFDGWVSPEEQQKMYNPDYLDFQKGVEAQREICKAKIDKAVKKERERAKAEIRCSQCGGAVIGYDEKHGYISRAFIECPECIEKNS